MTDDTAAELPATGDVDAVVVSGLLCLVTDVQAALAEFRRVLRPGGQLRFYEHVRSPARPHPRQGLRGRPVISTSARR